MNELVHSFQTVAKKTSEKFSKKNHHARYDKLRTPRSPADSDYVDFEEGKLKRRKIKTQFIVELS